MSNNKIILIGNGFDLSHDYRTNYYSFIQNLFKEAENNVRLHNNLFNFTERQKFGIDKELIKIQNLNKYIRTKNIFFGKIVKEFEEKKWSDIESLYFKELNQTNNIGKLNKEFDEIKGKLEDYLSNNIIYNNKNKSYLEFFERINSNSTTIINFNYTDTLNKLYSSVTSEMKIINIHGKIKNKNNPIIFGYAANFEEKKILLSKNDNRFLKNIKSYNYKRSDLENQLDYLLELNEAKTRYTNDEIDIFIIGHSCSLSDKNILKQIFSSEKISKINILYHESYEAYSDIAISIDRILESETNHKKIQNFNSSLKSPQYDDTNATQLEFLKKTKNI